MAASRKRSASACERKKPSREICDGLDNDCDEQIDEELLEPSEVVFQADERVLFPIATATNLLTQFRSNLLILNLESTPIDVTLQSGNATKVISLPGRTYRQLDQVGKQQLGLPAGTFMLTVHATGTWVGYVSTVDPVTGDPTTVRGQKAPAP